jgi:hypothetical protein
LQIISSSSMFRVWQTCVLTEVVSQWLHTWSIRINNITSIAKANQGYQTKREQELNKKNKKICRKSETTDKCQDLKTRPAGSS